MPLYTLRLFPFADALGKPVADISPTASPAVADCFACLLLGHPSHRLFCDDPLCAGPPSIGVGLESLPPTSREGGLCARRPFAQLLPLHPLSSVPKSVLSRLRAAVLIVWHRPGTLQLRVQTPARLFFPPVASCPRQAAPFPSALPRAWPHPLPQGAKAAGRQPITHHSVSPSRALRMETARDVKRCMECVQQTLPSFNGCLAPGTAGGRRSFGICVGGYIFNSPFSDLCPPMMARLSGCAYFTPLLRTAPPRPDTPTCCLSLSLRS
eukprot:GGOE01012217.1.p1 GENE.GGOE01012217.1~~GGOE01012217.1.p1  ORF type:complete len:267 (+),score=2.45 GGOE01012217.1:585-1385(+)